MEGRERLVKLRAALDAYSRRTGRGPLLCGCGKPSSHGGMCVGRGGTEWQAAQRERQRRGAAKRRRELCGRGHPLPPSRDCLICARERMRRLRAA